jgi:hypothetical protein
VLVHCLVQLATSNRPLSVKEATGNYNKSYAIYIMNALVWCIALPVVVGRLVTS